MKEYIVYQKRRNSNKHDVYKVKKEYDPKTKNSRQVGKRIYLGVADEKGGEYSKKSYSQVKKVYEYGGIKLLTEIQKEGVVDCNFFKNLDDFNRQLLLLLAYYFILTDYDLKHFTAWLSNQWYEGNQDIRKLTHIDIINKITEIGASICKIDVGKNVGRIIKGKKIEKAELIEEFDLKAKGNFYFVKDIHIRFEGTQWLLESNSEEKLKELSEKKENNIKEKLLYGVYFCSLDFNECRFITINQYALNDFSFLKNKFLLRIKLDNEISKKLSDIYCYGGQKSYDLGMGYALQESSGISQKLSEAISKNVKYVRKEIEHFQNRVKSSFQDIGDEYNGFSGAYFIFSLYLQLKNQILRQNDLFQCDCDVINDFFIQLGIENQSIKMVNLKDNNMVEV